MCVPEDKMGFCESGSESSACGCSAAAKADHALMPYLPLVAVLGGICLVAAVFASVESTGLQRAMSMLMALFFLVFGTLQAVNVKEYVPSLGRYHWLARVFPAYGYALPFAELGLAAVFMVDALHLYADPYLLMMSCWATLLIFTLDVIGVLGSLKKGLRPTCACLGMILAVPLSLLTVAEDVAMIAMAAYMLYGLAA